jgi:hypothetical protein
MGRKGAGHRAYLTRLKNERARKRKRKANKTWSLIGYPNTIGTRSKKNPSGHVVGFYKDQRVCVASARP